MQRQSLVFSSALLLCFLLLIAVFALIYWSLKPPTFYQSLKKANMITVQGLYPEQGTHKEYFLSPHTNSYQFALLMHLTGQHSVRIDDGKSPFCVLTVYYGLQPGVSDSYAWTHCHHPINSEFILKTGEIGSPGKWYMAPPELVNWFRSQFEVQNSTKSQLIQKKRSNVILVPIHVR